MSRSPGTPRVLHIHGSLARDNPQAERCVRLIEAFGGRLRHTLVAADGDFGAVENTTKGIAVERRATFPPLGGLPLPGRLQRIAREMVDFHLVLTYGRAGTGAALAHTSFSEVLALPPLIHHEDGSDETRLQRRGFRSRWLRRLGLGKSAGLVVPSETMEAVALVDWQQPLGRVKLIADGVDVTRFARPPASPSIGRLLKREGEYWLGCVVQNGDGADVAPWVDALAALDASWHLVIVGDLRRRDAIEQAVTRHALPHRVHLAGAVHDPATAMALFDMVVIAGGEGPLPLAAVYAMAAGKPVIGLDSAEAESVLAPENAALGRGDLENLAQDAARRHTIGEANRARARAERDEAAMIATYRRLYASAMALATI